jgi:choline dehydrogenase
MIVPQAKVMGGGSSINGGTFLRHTEADAREWVALGNAAWDFESSVAVYEGLEGDPLRGTHGPHPIARASMDEAGKIQAAFVEGAASCGLQRIPDPQATGAEGVGPSPVCRRGSTRVSAADTFIGPARLFPNLTILADSPVDRVLFQNHKAVTVVLANGHKIHATHEIILCAGAVFSPAILQRSGIGPTELLRRHGIAPVVELPVGLNLSDHPCIPLVARPRPGAYTDTDYSLQMQARWSSSLNPGAIDLQMVCFSYLFAQAADPSRPQRSLGGTETGHVAGIGCNINKPTSLGMVEIRSRDPNQMPIVRPDYLSTPHDRVLAREVVRTAYAVLTSPAMQAVLTAPLGITAQVVADDKMLDGYIQAQYSTTYHFCGSCRMASREKGGVVDQSGRVYGVNGLRVADASLLPTVPAANTMGSTMLVGERVGRSVCDGRSVQKATRSHI